MYDRYEFPTQDNFGSIEQFEENKKHMARRAVAGYAHDSTDCAELFDALDIWPEITIGS